MMAHTVETAATTATARPPKFEPACASFREREAIWVHLLSSEPTGKGGNTCVSERVWFLVVVIDYAHMHASQSPMIVRAAGGSTEAPQTYINGKLRYAIVLQMM